MLPMQGPQVLSLVRELDPTWHNYKSVCSNEDSRVLQLKAVQKKKKKKDRNSFKRDQNFIIKLHLASSPTYLDTTPTELQQNNDEFWLEELQDCL